MITYDEWCETHTNIMPMIKKLNSSLPEQYIGFYLSRYIDVPIEYTKQYEWLGRSSLDIVIPTFRLVIEYDGVRYHSDKRWKDNEKSELCHKNGFTLIRIQEDELVLSGRKDDIVITYAVSSNYITLEQPIMELLRIIHNRYQKITNTIDINIVRDQEKVIRYIQNKYYERTMAYHWPESFDYWDDSFELTPYDLFCTDGAPLKCPHCHDKVPYYPRYFHHRKSLVPCKCEYAQIEEDLRMVKEEYRRNGKKFSFDNTLRSRRIYDRIQQDIKYYCVDKDELQMYEEFGINIGWKKLLLK